jgi:outer membrane protein assembly factor BamB
MRFFVKLFSFLLILGFPNSVKSNQIITHFNINNEIWSAPFSQRWHFSDWEPINLAPVQTSNEIVIPNANGKLVKLDLLNGNFIWRSDLGGEIHLPMVIDEKKIYVVTSSSKTINNPVEIPASQTAKIENKETSNQVTTVLRAINIQSGLTTWQYELPHQDLISFDSVQNYLILAFRQGHILSLNKETGGVVWHKYYESGLAVPFSVFNDQIFIVDKKNQLFSFSTNGEVLKKIVVLPATPIGKCLISNNFIWFSDRFGTVYAFRQSDGKLLWYSRTGGEIKSIALASNSLLAASQDNHVYAFSPKKGKKQWKLKLTSRPLDILILDERNVLISTFSSNKLVLVDVTSGKIFNQIFMPPDEYPISNPLLTSQNSIVISTLTGIKSFSSTK